MKNIFISNIKIQKVRHLQDIEIILSQDKIKHLIFTGKNGSGKTSVLEALASHLNAAATSDRLEKAEKFLKKHMDELGQLRINDVENSKILEAEKAVERYSNELAAIQNGICVTLSESRDSFVLPFSKRTVCHSSLENALIYDLENGITVENGLSDIPYAGIVEGYFEASTLSDSLAEKYERYKELVNKEDLTDDDFEEIAGLELYLNEIPDYLALDITTEYQRLKLQFESREDV